MEFPILVYRCPGDHQRRGGTYSYQQVCDEERLAAALLEGWFETLPEAIDGRRADAHRGELITSEMQPPASILKDVEVQGDNAPPTRKELEQKAAELGLKYDGRIGDKRLASLIAEALAEE